MSSGDGRNPILSGMRVVDFSTHATGPFGTQILAALGAVVVKVERPPAGDPERSTEWPVFLANNRGKLSVGIDTRQTEGRKLLDSLIAGADVVVEGFRPGVADRMGYGYERVSELQPRVIYVSLPGFGSDGPYANRRGYDGEFRAIAGDVYLNRDDAGMPQYAEASPAFDYATGMYAALGIVCCYLAPDRTAVHLEVPIVAAGLVWSFARLIDPFRSDSRPPSRLQHIFRTADGNYMTITFPMEDQFRALCRVLNLEEETSDPALATLEQRRAVATRLNHRVSEAVARHGRGEMLKLLGDADVPCAPILAPGEVFADAQVQHLNVIHDGATPWADLPIAGLARHPMRHPPSFDEHGDAARLGGWEALASVAEALALGDVGDGLG